MIGNFLDKVMADLEAKEEAKAQEEAERRGVSIEVIYRENEQRQKEVEEAQCASARAYEERRRTLADEEFRRRKAYGESLGLGVAAHNGNVVVLSGCTERGTGSGMNKATVEHVVLDEAFCKSRMRRKAGDLLCKPYSRLGKRTMGVSGTAIWGVDGGLSETSWKEGRVTCKACLKILKRLNGENNG